MSTTLRQVCLICSPAHRLDHLLKRGHWMRDITASSAWLNKHNRGLRGFGRSSPLEPNPSKTAPGPARNPYHARRKVFPTVDPHMDCASTICIGKPISANHKHPIFQQCIECLRSRPISPCNTSIFPYTPRIIFADSQFLGYHNTGQSGTEISRMFHQPQFNAPDRDGLASVRPWLVPRPHTNIRGDKNGCIISRYPRGFNVGANKLRVISNVKTRRNRAEHGRQDVWEIRLPK